MWLMESEQRAEREAAERRADTVIPDGPPQGAEGNSLVAAPWSKLGIPPFQPAEYGSCSAEESSVAGQAGLQL